MARLNVSLPDDLYALATKWRGTVNLSEICTRALREELDAVETGRFAVRLSSMLHTPTLLESTLAGQYGLLETVVCLETGIGPNHREELGEAAARYLDRSLTDGAVLAFAGGRQMWNVVRNLAPRNVRADITAIGIEQSDPQALHTHPNTLLTLLWLLYGPRSKAHLVGAHHFRTIWNLPADGEAVPRYVVMASCGRFSSESPFANLLGGNVTRTLTDNDVSADFAYVFFRNDGQVINSITFPHKHVSVFSGDQLKRLSERSDARVILVAGGVEKVDVVLWVLQNRLCNVLVTDVLTAKALVANKEVCAHGEN